MGLLAWVIVGALAGLVASPVTGTNRARGGLANLLVGIVGAVLGGLLFGGLRGRSTLTALTAFDFGSLLVAVLGAVGLLLLLRLVRRA